MCWDLVNLSNCPLLSTNAMHKSSYTMSPPGNIILYVFDTLEVGMYVDGGAGDSLCHVSALDKVIHDLY